METSTSSVVLFLLLYRSDGGDDVGVSTICMHTQNRMI